jgi:hypothetical protein
LLPVMWLALTVQILAPVAACWATAIAASDPLAAAVMCRNSAPSGETPDDGAAAHRARSGCCAAFCPSHAGAPAVPEQAAGFLHVDRPSTRIDWSAVDCHLPAYRTRAHAQARGPPNIS